MSSVPSPVASILPPSLVPGDSIAVVSPGFATQMAHLTPFLDLAAAAGFNVELGKYTLATWGPFAGTEAQRLEDLSWALTAPHIRAVVFSRGGFGMSQLIDQLPLDSWQPRWVCGFSDATLLLNHLVRNHGTACIHGPGAASARKPMLVPHVHQMLSYLMEPQGHGLTFTTEPGPAFKVHGTLVGGNLTLLAHAIGTRSFPQLEGSILFIEEVGEALYHIDRLWQQLRRAGVLPGIRAVILGQFSEIKRGNIAYPLSLTEIFRQGLDAHVPVLTGLPVGHDDDANAPLVLGRPTMLHADGRGNARLRWH